MQAILLAGGLGTRLRSVVSDRPKPMALIEGRPFMEYVTRELVRSGIDEIIFAVGYKGTMVEEYFGDGKRFGFCASYAYEETLLGTAGAIRNAGRFITEERFFVLNADTFYQIDYTRLKRLLDSLDLDMALVLREVPDVSRYGQAILNQEEHVKDIDYLITLEGYVHWMLTGKRVLGIGDVAGMFPVDIHTKDFDQKRIDQFDELVAGEHFPWKLRDILPKALVAGQDAGVLTEEGARLLDVSGNLKPGIPMCPPEGDAGTGMAATNSVAVRTGNVSAGTSVFAMVVLEKELEHVYPEIDLVTTPAGDMVAMVHCNNCTSDLNAWVNLFREFAENMGMKVDMNDLFGKLYNKALEGDADCGGLLAYNYFSGEHITHFEEGRPLFVRMPDSRFNLANFMRVHLYTSLGALKTGMDILLKKENVKVDTLLGHGGLFKTKGVGQRILAGAMNAPVSVMETAGEGGAWGIALLASYMRNREEGETLDAYLADKVFGGDKGITAEPVKEDVESFEAFMKRYARGLAIEKAAVEHMG